MNLTKFCLYTILGAACWNGFLAWVGFKLKTRWDEVMKYSHVIDIVVVGAILLTIIYLVYQQKKRVAAKANSD